MRAIKRLLGFVIGLAIVGLGISMVLPTNWSVVRVLEIRAEPDRIHPHVDNLAEWPAWVGWAAKDDVSFKYDLTSAGSGVGSSLAWTSTQQKDGKLTLIRSDREEGVAFDVSLEAPAMIGHGAIAYAFDRDARTTSVTWSMNGSFSGRPLAGFWAVVAGMTVGPRLESGLRQLKRLAEN